MVEKVTGFDISMNDVIMMQFFESLKYLIQNPWYFMLVIHGFPVLHDISKRAILAVLHQYPNLIIKELNAVTF